MALVGGPGDSCGVEVPADSAGVAWAGRRLTRPRFADDRGDGDPQVLAALRELADAVEGVPGGRAGESAAPACSRRWAAERALLGALTGSRVLVPLVAAPPELPDSAGGQRATVTLISPDGQRAQPVFTGVAELARWDQSARPTPTSTGEAARAALADDCQALLVDLGAAHAAVLRPSMLWALAQGRDWLPPDQDPVVVAALTAAADGLPGVVAARPQAGPPDGRGALGLSLVLAPGLGLDQVQATAARIGQALAADEQVRIRLDAVDVTVAAGAG